MALGNQFTQSNEIANLAGQSLYADYANAKILYDKAFDYFVHTNPSSMVANTLGAKKGRMGGRKKVGLVTYALPQSMGSATFEGADFPEAKVGSYDNPELKAKKRHGRLKFTNDVLSDLRMGSEARFVNTRSRDMEDGETQWNLNHIRNLILGGPDILGVVASVGGTNNATITLAGRNDRDSDAADFYKSGAHYLENGMAVSFLDQTYATNGVTDAPCDAQEDNAMPASGTGGGVFVSSLDRTTTPTAPTFVLKDTLGAAQSPYDDRNNGALTLAAGDMIIAYGSRKDSVDGSGNASGNYTYGAEDAAREDKLGAMNGLLPIACGSQLQTYLYTLSKSTIPGLKGFYDHGSGTKRAFRDKRITFMLDQIEEQGNGKYPDKLLLNKSLRREVVAEHEGEVLYSPVQEAERGFKRLMHSGGDVVVPYFTDRAMLPSIVSAIRSDSWGYWSQRDFTSLPERWVNNKDSIEIPYVQMGNTECVAPLNNGAIDDLLDDVHALL